MITHEDLEKAIENILGSLNENEQYIIRSYFGIGYNRFSAKQFIMDKFQLSENEMESYIQNILLKIRHGYGRFLKPYYEELKERIQLKEYNEENRLDKNIPACGNRNPLKPEDYQYLPIIPRIKPVYYFSSKYNEYVPY